MGKRSSDHYRALASTILLIVLWIVLPVFVRSLTRETFYEFQAPSWHAISWVDDIQNYWALKTLSKQELREAGRDLSRVNAAYKIMRQEQQTLKQELASLEHVLNIPPLPQYKYEVARVARREINAWWHHLIIRKGADYDIPEGSAVVFHDGVVGKVKEVMHNTSIVELLSSPTFRMAATFEGDRRPVTYQGVRNTPLTEAIGNVRDVPPDIKTSTETPQKLISSRLGGVFPQGLYIGDVIFLEPDNNGLFTRGIVKLNPELRNIYEVAILIPVSPQTGEN